MGFNTLAQVVARVKSDLRNAVDSDVLVEWANDVQEDMAAVDLPYYITLTTFTSTDDDLQYDLTDIASNIRKIREVYIDLTQELSPYDVDYEVKREWRYKYLDFTQTDTELILQDDPEGHDITVAYYRVPTAVDDINDTLDIPLRWHRGVYLGMMNMATEHQYKTPNGNWVTLFENYKTRIHKNETTKNKGADTVGYYSVLSE